MLRSKLQDLIHIRLLRDESRNADIRNIANHILDVLSLRNRVDRKLLFTIHHCTAIVYNIFAAMILYLDTFTSFIIHRIWKCSY